MRKSILLLALILTVISVMAQTDYEQWEVMNLNPKADKLDLFKKGLAAHDKKFHSAAPYHASVSSVITGPNSGQFTWVMGPTTWTQLDGRPNKGEHDMDWDKNVVPYVESFGEVSYWRADKDLKYRPENVNMSTFTKGRIRFYTVLPGQMDRLKELFKKVVEVYTKKQYKASYSLYLRQGATTGSHVAVSIDFDKWAYFDNGTDFTKDYNEVHGPNSFNRYLDDMALCIDRTKTYDELNETIPELGGN